MTTGAIRKHNATTTMRDCHRRRDPRPIRLRRVPRRPERHVRSFERGASVHQHDQPQLPRPNGRQARRRLPRQPSDRRRQRADGIRHRPTRIRLATHRNRHGRRKVASGRINRFCVSTGRTRPVLFLRAEFHRMPNLRLLHSVASRKGATCLNFHQFFPIKARPFKPVLSATSDQRGKSHSTGIRSAESATTSSRTGARRRTSLMPSSSLQLSSQ